MINILEKWKFIIFCVLFLIILLFLISRHGDHLMPLRNYVSQLKQNAAKQHALHKAPSISLPTAVTYDAGSLLAPFGETTSTPKTAANEHLANPLLAYSLNVLRFVGTLSMGSLKYAFVVAPDNVVYQLGIGDPVGPNQGKVVDIQPQRLDVMEKSSENGNLIKERVVSLELKEER